MINSIEELISKVKDDYANSGTKTLPWFRGEPNNTPTPLLPNLYRPKEDGSSHNENQLLQQFRMKAPSLGLMNTPPHTQTDQWLFLAQHVRLPTRLLDWTEGLFIALHFALRENEPVVWMLDPIGLNRLSCPDNELADNSFPLTWYSEETSPIFKDDLFALKKFMDIGEEEFKKAHPDHYFVKPIKRNIGHMNIQGAWEFDAVGTDLPVAIHPTYVHIRMSMQKSCFTIQGKVRRSLNCLVESSILRKYVINKDSVLKMRDDLRVFGITNTSVFPDLDNLSRDLSEMF